MGLFETASSLLNPASTVSDTMSGLGGEGTDASKSSATGSYTAGGLNITKEDSTIKIALIIGGVVLVLALLKGRRR